MKKSPPVSNVKQKIVDKTIVLPSPAPKKPPTQLVKPPSVFRVMATKVWGWIKAHVLVIVSVITLVVLGLIFIPMALSYFSTVSASKEAELRALIAAQHDQQVREIASLNQSFEQQRQAQQALDAQYQARLADLEQKYTAALERIRVTTATRRRRLQDNPTELPGAIQNTFGIPPGDAPQ